MQAQLMAMIFGKKPFDKYVVESVNPFIGHEDKKAEEFVINCCSPDELYYTSIFSSLLLDENQAWLLYKKLFDGQQIIKDKKSAKDIMDKIPECNISLEKKFKELYKNHKNLELQFGKIKNI